MQVLEPPFGLWSSCWRLAVFELKCMGVGAASPARGCLQRLTWLQGEASSNARSTTSVTCSPTLDRAPNVSWVLAFCFDRATYESDPTLDCSASLGVHRWGGPYTLAKKRRGRSPRRQATLRLSRCGTGVASPPQGAARRAWYRLRGHHRGGDGGLGAAFLLGHSVSLVRMCTSWSSRC